MSTPDPKSRYPLQAGLPPVGSKEREYLNTAIRIRLEALKFVPEYARAWDRLQNDHGREAVLRSLRVLRESLEAPAGEDDDLVLVLANLAPTSRIGRLGPVDPHDPDDPRDLDSMLEQLDSMSAGGPFWFLKYLGVGHPFPNHVEREGWVSLSVDLRQSKTVLRAAMDVLVRAMRAEAGVTDTKRVLRERCWDDDRGPATAFRLLRAVSGEPETSQRQHARDVLPEWYTPEQVDKEASEFLAHARSWVEEERSWYLREQEAKHVLLAKVLPTDANEDGERLEQFYRFLLEYADLVAGHVGWDPREDPALGRLARGR